MNSGDTMIDMQDSRDTKIKHNKELTAHVGQTVR